MLKKRFVMLLLVIWLAGGGIGHNAWAALAEVSTAELIHQASDVVRAEVVSISSAWNEKRDFIFTTISLHITEAYKGTISNASSINVIIPGGEVDGIGLGVEHAPRFEKGEDVIVLLRETGEGTYAVVGWEMGKFNVRDGQVIEKGVPIDQFKEEIRRAAEDKTDVEGEK